ncbi:MAG: ComEC/Rec2 family competence protein, partial [Veillonella sp.]|nr:ComEC/Rec2 family competence protein [Veillonella sp.]
MEVGAFLLSAYILGIIYAYALKVTIHEPAAMILFIASGLLLTYISLGFVRSRSVAWLIQAFIAIALLVAAGYSRADHLITNYQADYPCFSNYETVYKGTILEDGDKSSDGDHMKYKVQLEAFYMDKEGIQENWTTLQEKPTIEVYVPIRANGNLNAYSHDNQEAYSHDNQEAHSNEKQDATQLSWANTTKDSDWMQEGDSGYSFRGGDQVLVKGKVKPIHPLDDRGEIDRQARAISQNLVGRIYDGQMQATGHKERWLSLCSSIRHKVDGMLQDHLPGNLAYVASSLLLGGHYGEIEQETMQDFSYTGLIHILSVSGSHIALISALTYGILHLCKIPKRRAVYIVILVLIAYASLVGF